MRVVLEQLLRGEHLSKAQAEASMDTIFSGEATEAQIGSLLTLLRVKGETVDEITGFASAMRNRSPKVYYPTKGLLDTCGTGGDGANTYNISTAAAIVSAAGGTPVAKHGNRAMSSSTGSADVLEALGVNIHINETQAQHCLQQVGICFMFAQQFHPSMKFVAGARKQLGFRTVFNMLGPLTNPAGAEHQLMGLFDRSKTETVAKVMRELGVQRALVVASEDGLDEISISAPTKVTELRHGEITTYHVTPEHFGLQTHPIEHIKGGNTEENAAIIQSIFAGEQGAKRDILIANAGASLYVSGQASSLLSGAKQAAEIIDQGLAKEKLQQLVQMTKEFKHVS
ncbi:anthranilate phosphoribosyltransferase [Longirhabdus pacifica]|uniref:anthranilate phosphoribosyltransferase n=1 Tax=Longirhabdus pacifica TaxID=2305227 RepID=UPI00100879B1|nr:anthranilate phosphoribosyltransferase [Longirhabdus pacifica]